MEIYLQKQSYLSYNSGYITNLADQIKAYA